MKNFLSLALCIVAVGSMSAQKSNVDAAKKLAGKIDKIEEARQLIGLAKESPETANDPLTYFTAGEIEYKAFDKAKQAAGINPQDPKADPMQMAEELLNGYDNFIKVFELDQVDPKKKLTNDAIGKISGHANDFFNVGGIMWEAKRYYPEAYKAFYTFAELPEMEILGKKAPKFSDADRAQSYFNAGIAAYSGNSVDDAANAFHKAQLLGFEDPNAYIYELACWQNIAQNDSTRQTQAQERIAQTAKAGYEKFGLAQPVFLNNMINSLVMDEKYDEAISTLSSLIAENPDNINLIGLRAFVYDRAGNDEASINDYNTAAHSPGVDYETLKNAARKYYRTASNKLGNLAQGDVAGKKEIMDNYLLPGVEITKMALQTEDGQYDSDLNNIFENYSWTLKTNYNYDVSK